VSGERWVEWECIGWSTGLGAEREEGEISDLVEGGGGFGVEY